MFCCVMLCCELYISYIVFYCAVLFCAVLVLWTKYINHVMCCTLLYCAVYCCAVLCCELYLLLSHCPDPLTGCVLTVLVSPMYGRRFNARWRHPRKRRWRYHYQCWSPSAREDRKTKTRAKQEMGDFNFCIYEHSWIQSRLLQFN